MYSPEGTGGHSGALNDGTKKLFGTTTTTGITRRSRWPDKANDVRRVSGRGAFVHGRLYAQAPVTNNIVIPFLEEGGLHPELIPNLYK